MSEPPPAKALPSSGQLAEKEQMQLQLIEEQLLELNRESGQAASWDARKCKGRKRRKRRICRLKMVKVNKAKLGGGSKKNSVVKKGG